jgi:hypothetical protein
MDFARADEEIPRHGGRLYRSRLATLKEFGVSLSPGYYGGKGKTGGTLNAKPLQLLLLSPLTPS